MARLERKSPMARYGFEYRNDRDEVYYSRLMSRRAAMAEAKRISAEKDITVYVLDEDRNGHVAYVSGKIDHREGADV
jgi:hypothetical protein